MHAGATAYPAAHFGQGSREILLDDVNCTGLEAQLLTCRYDTVTSDCNHSEDASVQCQPESKLLLKHSETYYNHSMCIVHYRSFWCS